jgi:hypothetical protein
VPAAGGTTGSTSSNVTPPRGGTEEDHKLLLHVAATVDRLAAEAAARGERDQGARAAPPSPPPPPPPPLSVDLLGQAAVPLPSLPSVARNDLAPHRAEVVTSSLSEPQPTPTGFGEPRSVFGAGATTNRLSAASQGGTPTSFGRSAHDVQAATFAEAAARLRSLQPYDASTAPRLSPAAARRLRERPLASPPRDDAPVRALGAGTRFASGGEASTRTPLQRSPYQFGGAPQHHDDPQMDESLHVHFGVPRSVSPPAPPMPQHQVLFHHTSAPITAGGVPGPAPGRSPDAVRSRSPGGGGGGGVLAKRFSPPRSETWTAPPAAHVFASTPVRSVSPPAAGPMVPTAARGGAAVGGGALADRVAKAKARLDALRLAEQQGNHSGGGAIPAAAVSAPVSWMQPPAVAAAAVSARTARSFPTPPTHRAPSSQGNSPPRFAVPPNPAVVEALRTSTPPRGGTSPQRFTVAGTQASAQRTPSPQGANSIRPKPMTLQQPTTTDGKFAFVPSSAAAQRLQRMRQQSPALATGGGLSAEAPAPPIMIH